MVLQWMALLTFNTKHTPFGQSHLVWIVAFGAAIWGRLVGFMLLADRHFGLDAEVCSRRLLLLLTRGQIAAAAHLCVPVRLNQI